MKAGRVAQLQVVDAQQYRRLLRQFVDEPVQPVMDREFHRGTRTQRTPEDLRGPIGDGTLANRAFEQLPHDPKGEVLLEGGGPRSQYRPPAGVGHLTRSQDEGGLADAGRAQDSDPGTSAGLGIAQRRRDRAEFGMTFDQHARGRDRRGVASSHRLDRILPVGVH